MRYKITIEYDGTNLLGWQKQPDGPSVQGYLEDALTAFAGKYIIIQDNRKPFLSLKDESKDGEDASGAYSNVHEEASTGKLLQASNSNIKAGFSEKNGVDSTERSTGAYSNVREEESTGKLLQASNSNIKAGFSEKNGVDSTERSTGAYSNVREEASTGKLLQASDKTSLIQGAGRTDAGVHALGQVAHFDLSKDIDCFRIREAFNAQLRDLDAPVTVLSAEKVDDKFHARFSAKGRAYIYRILNRRAPAALLKDRVWWVPVSLDIEKMKQGAELLLGHHDFTSFRAAACQALSPLKTLDKLDIFRQDEEIIFSVEARSFLHHQVRNMVGTLKMIGDGHLHPQDIIRILEARNRSAAGPTAPAHGLYLHKVLY